MEFNLNEVLVALMVGSFFLLTIESMVFYFHGTSITGFFEGEIGGSARQKDGKPAPRHVSLVVMLAAAIPIGVILENVALEVTESHPERISAPLRLAHMLFQKTGSIEPARILGVSFEPLRSKSHVRASTLMRYDLINGGEQAGSVNIQAFSPLGKELLRNGLLSDSCGSEGWVKDAKSWLNDIDEKSREPKAPLQTTISALSCIDGLYYKAKNRVFLENSLLDEMRRIDTRRRLSASVALVALHGAILACALLTISRIAIWAVRGAETTRLWTQWFVPTATWVTATIVWTLAFSPNWSRLTAVLAAVALCCSLYVASAMTSVKAVSWKGIFLRIAGGLALVAVSFALILVPDIQAKSTRHDLAMTAVLFSVLAAFFSPALLRVISEKRLFGLQRLIFENRIILAIVSTLPIAVMLVCLFWHFLIGSLVLEGKSGLEAIGDLARLSFVEPTRDSPQQAVLLGTLAILASIVAAQLAFKRHTRINDFSPQWLSPHAFTLTSVHLGLILFYGAVYVGAAWATSRETVEFNRRAFGYFSTLNSYEIGAPLRAIDVPGAAPNARAALSDLLEKNTCNCDSVVEEGRARGN